MENIEALRRQLSANKQEKVELEVQLERERIAISTLESELETEKALQVEALGNNNDYCGLRCVSFPRI